MDLLLSREDLNRRWASYHEAGHAVAAWRRGLPPGGLGLVIDRRGRGVYYHGWILWRLLVPQPTSLRRKVLAGVEMFQAGLVAEYISGSHCSLFDDPSVRRELDSLLDCHVPGRWGTTCRNIRLSLGCGVDELDDARRALLLLLVYSSRDNARLVGDPLEPGAIDWVYRLPPAEPREIVRSFLRSQQRLLRALRRPRTWCAIEDLAGELFELGSVSPERAVQIMKAARAPRLGLQANAVSIESRSVA